MAEIGGLVVAREGRVPRGRREFAGALVGGLLVLTINIGRGPSRAAPRAGPRRRRRPPRRLSLRPSTSACSPSRSARTSGRPTARCGGAATRGRSWWSTSPSSPFRVGVISTRREMLATRSADNEVTLAYANMVGAQDGLVFDGGGFVFQNGRPMLEAPRFREGWTACVVDLDRTVSGAARGLDLAERLRGLPAPGDRRCRCCAASIRRCRRESLRLSGAGLGEPFPAGGGAPSRIGARGGAGRADRGAGAGGARLLPEVGRLQLLGVALSGGRDSMLTLLIAWRAACLLQEDGKASEEEVRAAGRGDDPGLLHADPLLGGGDPRRRVDARPRSWASPCAWCRSRRLSTARWRRRGRCWPAASRPRSPARTCRRACGPPRMWNWANSSGALFLQTGDMSEKAVGYTTIGGDLEGALSVIANVPKTVVSALLERLPGALRLRGHPPDAGHRARPGARRRADGGGRADALPGARRLPLPLREREASPARGGPRAARALPRDPGGAAGRLGRALRRAVHPLDLQVGAVPPRPPRGLARPRPRAGAAAPGGAAQRVAGTDVERAGTAARGWPPTRRSCSAAWPWRRGSRALAGWATSTSTRCTRRWR